MSMRRLFLIPLLLLAGMLSTPAFAGDTYNINVVQTGRMDGRMAAQTDAAFRELIATLMEDQLRQTFMDEMRPEDETYVRNGGEDLTPEEFEAQVNARLIPRVEARLSEATFNVMRRSTTDLMPHRQSTIPCEDNGNDGCLNDDAGRLYRKPGNLLAVGPDTLTFHICNSTDVITNDAVAQQFQSGEIEDRRIVDLMDDLQYEAVLTALNALGTTVLPCLDDWLSPENLWQIYFFQGMANYRNADGHDDGLGVARDDYVRALHASPEHAWNGDYEPGSQVAYERAIRVLDQEEDGDIASNAVQVQVLGSFTDLRINTQNWVEGIHLHPGLHVIQWTADGRVFTRVVEIPEGEVNKVLYLVDGESWARSLLTFPEDRTDGQQAIVNHTLRFFQAAGDGHLGIVDFDQNPVLGLVYATGGDGIPVPVENLPAKPVVEEEGGDDDAEPDRPEPRPFVAIPATPGQMLFRLGGACKVYAPATSFCGVSVGLDGHISNGFGLSVRGDIGLTSVIYPDGTTVPGDLVSLAVGPWYKFWLPGGLRPIVMLEFNFDFDSFGQPKPTVRPAFQGGGGLEVVLPKDDRFRARFSAMAGAGFDDPRHRFRFNGIAEIVIELRKRSVPEPQVSESNGESMVAGNGD